MLLYIVDTKVMLLMPDHRLSAQCYNKKS